MIDAYTMLTTYLKPGLPCRVYYSSMLRNPG